MGVHVWGKEVCRSGVGMRECRYELKRAGVDIKEWGNSTPVERYEWERVVKVCV